MNIYLQLIGENTLYLANVGGAHGHPIAENSLHLWNAVLKKVKEAGGKKDKDYTVFCFTNSGQVKARAQLKEIGFEDRPSGNLLYHTLPSEKFATASVEIKKKLEEEEREKQRLKEEALKARNERDIREGRKIGEIREGDLVHYYTHKDTDEPYIALKIEGNDLRYMALNSMSYYNLSPSTIRSCYLEPLSRWRRISPERQSELNKEWVKKVEDYFSNDK